MPAQGDYPCGHPLHPTTGNLMSVIGSMVGLAAGIYTFILAQINDLPIQYASAGILIGIAAIITAAMPAILRCINWRIEETRENRRAQEARHDLAGKVQVATTRIDVQDRVIRKALQHIRTADRVQYAAILADREWMRKVAREHGVALPPDFGRRAFDDPGWRGEIDRLFKILDIDAIGVTPDPDADDAPPSTDSSP